MFGGKSRVFRKAASTALMCALFVGVGIALHALAPSIAYAESGDFNWSSGFVAFIGSVLASFVHWLANMVGSLTLIVIQATVVNILNYNNFSSSSIVTLGWTLTRDVVNMFAVIVLLILAVKTMISRGGGAWQQHLPRFFLGIVFANFSRTLCGLAIDASQVVMMTFVNALMGIAAGNFAQLMVMPQMTTYSDATFEAAAQSELTNLVTVAANVANAYAMLLVQVVVLVVMILLAVAFLWRIVVLWIALIMAPIAGFSWGSMDIVKFLGRFWNEWVGQFVPPLMLGPMLAFFLYLALAASANGNLAKAEAFPAPETEVIPGQVNLEVFESTNFTGLMIAVVFLVLGIRESAKISAKMGGLAAMALNEKTTGRAFRAGSWVAGAGVGIPAKLAARGTLKASAVAGLGLEAGLGALGNRVGGKTGAFVKGLGSVTGGGLKTAARLADEQVRMIPTDASKLPGYAKNRAAAAAGMGGKFATKAGEATGSAVRKASDGVGGFATEITKGVLGKDAAEKFGAAITGGLTAAGLAIGPNALLSTGSALNNQEHHVSEEEAKAAKDRVSHMTNEERAARLKQSLDGTGEKSLEAFADAAHMKGLLLKDKKFNDTFKDTLGTEEYEAAMGKIFHDLQHEDEAGHLSVEKETWDKARTKYADVFLHAAGEEKAKKFFASEDFNIKNMREGAAAKPALAFTLAATQTTEKKDGKFVTRFDQMTDRQKTQVEGASGKMYGALNEVGKGDVSNDTMRALSRLEGDASSLDATTIAKMEAQLKAIESAGGQGFAESELAAIRKNLVASGKTTLESVYGGTVYDAATFDLKNRKNFKSLISDDPTVLRHVDDAALADASQDTTKTTFEALSKESIEKMKDLADSGARKKADVVQALNKVKRVLDAMEAKARNNVSKADLAALAQKIRQAGDDVQNATTDADRQKHQAIQSALQAQRQAMVDQMDNDALAKIKGLRGSQESAERYL